MLAPLKRRDFRLLWTGMAVSLLGTAFLSLPWHGRPTPSPTGPRPLPMSAWPRPPPRSSFLLVGGAVSDRFPRRALLFWADVARGLAVAVLSVLLASGTLASTSCASWGR